MSTVVTIKRVCISVGALLALTLATVGTRAQAPPRPRRRTAAASGRSAGPAAAARRPAGRCRAAGRCPGSSGRTPIRSPARRR